MTQERPEKIIHSVESLRRAAVEAYGWDPGWSDEEAIAEGRKALLEKHLRPDREMPEFDVPGHGRAFSFVRFIPSGDPPPVKEPKRYPPGTKFQLVRIGTEHGYSMRQFADPDLEVAVAEAVEWFSDRTNHGLIPPEPDEVFFLDRKDWETGEWVRLDRELGFFST